MPARGRRSGALPWGDMFSSVEDVGFTRDRRDGRGEQPLAAALGARASRLPLTALVCADEIPGFLWKPGHGEEFKWVPRAVLGVGPTWAAPALCFPVEEARKPGVPLTPASPALGAASAESLIPCCRAAQTHLPDLSVQASCPDPCLHPAAWAF